MQPTDEQIAALREYRNLCLEAGREDWKRSLARDWQRSGTDLDVTDWALLQQMRNRFGLRWLAFTKALDTDN